MKQLLIILFCLFVSFEVSSKEIILSCEILKQTRGRGDSEKQVPLDSKNFPEILHLDVEEKWLDSENKDLFFKRMKKRKDIDYKKIKFEFKILQNEYFSRSSIESSWGSKHIIRLDRYNGNYFKRIILGKGKGVWTNYGKCKKVKKRLF